MYVLMKRSVRCMLLQCWNRTNRNVYRHRHDY